MTTPRPATFVPLLALLMLLLAACGGGAMSVEKQQEAVLRRYASAIRWSEFETAWMFVDPVYREAHPLTDLEQERLKQIQVTGYEVMHMEPSADGHGVEQDVAIRLINKHTQLERQITDRQHWVFDATTKQWWLATGLPDFSPR
jgi:hypothetical protein